MDYCRSLNHLTTPHRTIPQPTNSATMPTYSTYNGQLASIPDTSTPGLVFLKSYVPLLDSASPPMGDLASPNAVLITNGGPPMKVTDLAPMFSMRAEALDLFSHMEKDMQVWDLEGDAGKRTVIWSSVSR